jgi:hypothetical protein
MFSTDIPNQVDRIGEIFVTIVLTVNIVFLAPRRITTQGKYVPDP